MTRNYLLAALLGLLLMGVAAGCEQTSIAEQEQIRNRETLLALTPTATPTPTSTPTPTNTPTSTPTIGPSPTPPPTATPTVTPIPSATPFPPTATPNPVLQGFSLCDQVAGDQDGGRFSMRVTAITTTVEAAFERVVFQLEAPGDSVLPSALARCVTGADDAAQAGRLDLLAPFVVQLDLAGWLHDDLFAASVATPTLEFSGTQVIRGLSYRVERQRTVGATVLIGLQEPRPFRLTREEQPLRLVLEVAKTSPLGPASDMLRVPSDRDARPSDPLFFLRDGDIWRLPPGGNPINLTNSPEIETAFAVSQRAGRVAFCRAIPGLAGDEALVASELWTVGLDGRDPEPLAGQGCADPAISLDGLQVAFSVNEAGGTPPRLSIWTVPMNGGEPERLTAAADEWSRYAPQWLLDGRLVYAATAEDGRNTLFMLLTDGRELDIGADLVKGEIRQARYRMLGRPIAAPDGRSFAVEALRPGGGADILLIDAAGKEISGISPISAGFWVRPFAWAPDGTLLYLVSDCPSSLLHAYTLVARAPGGSEQTLAIGQTFGSFGSAVALANGVAYVVYDQALPGPRGPLRAPASGGSALWFWDVQGGLRTALLESPDQIGALTP